MSLIETDDGCRVFFETKGKGDPLVLIPGLGGDGRFWAAVEPYLTDRYQVITVDHRGAGRSDKPEDGYSIARIASDVLQILDSLEIGSAHFVGHSTGGVVVQSIGIDKPQRTRSLTISASWARPDKRFRDLFVARHALMALGEAEIYQRLTHVLGFTSSFIATNAVFLENAVKASDNALAPFAVTAARIQMLLEYDRASELREVKAPTLLMGSRGDMMIPFDRTEELGELIPHAVLVELHGGHFYPREAPTEFSDALLGFLARI